MDADRGHRARDVLRATLLQPRSERARFLDGIGAVDAALRAEVERLLAEHAEDAARVAEPPTVDIPARSETVTAPSPGRSLPAAARKEEADRVPAPSGQRVGPYRFVREIGHGGMGAVYLAARDDDQFKKRVAIKLLRRGMESEEIVRRFRTERQILASIDHPNIARLLDGGATDEGFPYLVMEFIEGVPIDQYCDSHRLSTADRLKLIRQVCSAVHFAHQNLIVHRDIKPKNILVTKEATPKLLDFGIAKLLNPELVSSHVEMTRLEERMLTPQYASPEQVRGEPITTASDVYSLGVLLYELLTGHRPYRLESRAMHDITRVICEEEPTRPSMIVGEVEALGGASDAAGRITPEAVSRSREGSPEKLRRRLAGDLDNIVLMAMRKEPERRYVSAEQLSDDIRRHLEGLPVIARKDTFGYRTQKFVKRHRTAVVGAALVTLSLVAGVVVSARLALVAAGERDQARLQAEKSQQINRFVQEMLSSADPSEGQEGGRQVTVAQVLDRAAALARIDLASQPEVQAAVQNTIGGAYLGLGLYDAAETELRDAVAAQERLLGAEHPDLALTRANLASLLGTKGDLTSAEPMYRESLRVLKSVFGPEHPEVANVLSGLGQLSRAKGDHDAAEELHRESLAIRRKHYGNEHRKVAHSLNDLAVVFGTRGDYAAAEPLNREALHILQKLHGREDPDTAGAMGTLAFVLDQRGKYEEAEPLYRDALAIRRKLLGDEHPLVAWTTYNLADFLYGRGKYSESAGLARQALALRGRILPDGHPVVAASLMVLGTSLMGLGNPVGAEPLFRECVALRRKSLPNDHWLIASGESTLGACLSAQGRFSESERLLLSSYETLAAQLGGSHPRTVEARERIVKLYEAWGRSEKAAPYRTDQSRR